MYCTNGQYSLHVFLMWLLSEWCVTLSMYLCSVQNEHYDLSLFHILGGTNQSIIFMLPFL